MCIYEKMYLSMLSINLAFIAQSLLNLRVDGAVWFLNELFH